MLRLENGNADIYRHPEVCLSELPTWIRNIIIVMGYDTEIQMDGLSNKSYNDVIDALNVMGLNNDYDVFWEKVFQYADRNCSGARRAFY